ncbi:MAG: MATE family efflux transporter [Pseudomonadales bacterium]|nr:MATE family efflux transporter [Pseudomonadales bacterium]MDP6472285.1 MATE family efflux transporter [Pseudomonadales bacterium]MDP6828080.1 MATE family efflux transporter [Pseudomonadales bacterium]MDP6972558.1 MATE family efflux transporter [Pseudomonadales bacterium]
MSSSRSHNRLAADLTQGPIAGHLVRLTVPMFLGISSMFVAAVIDTVYVGLIGTDELAAMSFTFPVVMALSTVSMGIGVGASSIIARIAGSGDFSRVRRISTDALVLVSMLVLFLAVLADRYKEPLFMALGADETILPLSLEYMGVWFYGLPLFAIPMVSGVIMRAVGNARLPGVIMTSAAAIQVVLAPILIFGMGSYEGMGFVGAAWAFVFSRAVTFLYTGYALVKLELVIFELPGVAVMLESWREVMRIGIPSMMTNLIGPVSLAITVWLLAEHSNEVVAGFGIASRIESLAIMLLMAISASTGPFIGQNVGAGQLPRVYEAQRLAYRFSHAYSVGAFVLLALSGRLLVQFINSDPAVIDATYSYLLIMPATYGFLGVGMVAGSTFAALGNPGPSLVLSLIRMLVLYVPLALAGDLLFGYRGIFAAGAISNVLIGIASSMWVRRTLEAGKLPALRANAEGRSPSA